MKFNIFAKAFGLNAMTILRKSHIKGHYRKLKNGKIIWIQEYTDKRKQAQKDPEQFKGKIVHADDKGTTIVHHDESKNKYYLEHHPHDASKEMSDEEVYNTLNAPITVDENLAMKLFAYIGWRTLGKKEKPVSPENEAKILASGNWIGAKNPGGDIIGFYKKLADEGRTAKEAGDNENDLVKENVTNIETARQYVKNKYIKPMTKYLKSELGTVTTKARLAENKLGEHFYKQVQQLAQDDTYVSEAHMALYKKDEAMAYADDEQKNVEKSLKMTKEDCPKIPGLSENIKAFGHQAEVLAKLNVLHNAIIDVDMGGGKGLLLPADAVNLMAQGKIKRPLIMVPAMTLDQNADKIAKEYFPGQVNVFKISTDIINESYGGDELRMVEDIKNAPPNTVFMCTYSALSYADKYAKEVAGEDANVQKKRAFRIAQAEFDYVALDESHNVKNPNTDIFKCLQYFGNAKYKRAASGTVISNNPLDSLGTMMFMNPGAGMKEAKFKEKYGYQETEEGRMWTAEGTKRLREDLLAQGMISVRRDAWIHLLPQRNEKPSVIDLKGDLLSANEAAISDTVMALKAEAENNPELAKQLGLKNGEETEEAGGDYEDEDDEETADDLDIKSAKKKMEPGIEPIAAIGILTSITDFPDEYAQQISEADEILKTHKQEWQNALSQAEAEFNDIAEGEGSGRQATDLQIKRAASHIFAVELGLDADQESAIKASTLLRDDTRKYISKCKGMTSPKAEDFYAKAREHMAKKGSGKIVMFCSRRMSAQHVIDHAPEDLKKSMIYYDARVKENLAQFLDQSDGTPKILVAVDASVSEGINMQLADMMYRYDLGYSPGKVEQSYARIWRFGQKKPVDIHVGLCNGSMDVTKYCRLLTKYHENMQVISDYVGDPNRMAYKLNLNNIRNHRHAPDVDVYKKVSTDVLDYQNYSNIGMQKRFGKEAIPVSKDAHKWGGGHIPNMSFHPAYHVKEDIMGIPLDVPANLDDAIMHGLSKNGLDEDSLREDEGKNKGTFADTLGNVREDTDSLFRYLNGKKIGDKESKPVIEQFWNDYEKLRGVSYDKEHKKIIEDSVSYFDKSPVTAMKKTKAFDEADDYTGYLRKKKQDKLEKKMRPQDGRELPFDDKKALSHIADVYNSVSGGLVSPEDRNFLMTHVKALFRQSGGEVNAAKVNKYIARYEKATGKTMPQALKLTIDGAARRVAKDYQESKKEEIGAPPVAKKIDKKAARGHIAGGLAKIGKPNVELAPEYKNELVNHAEELSNHTGTPAQFWKNKEAEIKGKISANHRTVVEHIVKQLKGESTSEKEKAPKTSEKPQFDESHIQAGLKHAGAKIKVEDLEPKLVAKLKKDATALSEYVGKGGTAEDFWRGKPDSENHKKVVQHMAGVKEAPKGKMKVIKGDVFTRFVIRLR